MSDAPPTNPTLIVGPQTTTAIFAYGGVTIHIALATPSDIASLAPDEAIRKFTPSLRRALGVALEDLA